MGYLSGYVSLREGAMAVDDVTVTVTLPRLRDHDSGEAVACVQHMLNDLDRRNGEELLLHESFEFGDATKDRVFRFQEENNLPDPSGRVGPRTWEALLRAWLEVVP
jgi:hypothetical protein